MSNPSAKSDRARFRLDVTFSDSMPPLDFNSPFEASPSRPDCSSQGSESTSAPPRNGDGEELRAGPLGKLNEAMLLADPKEASVVAREKFGENDGTLFWPIAEAVLLMDTAEGVASARDGARAC
eukprot:scaffold127995_cov31-Tisochrysis_lutea.AAC.2